MPDQRGHGFSTLAADPQGRLDWLDFRDDLIALGRALEVEGAILAGHSMGATVSLLAAAEAPRLARRLALFDPVVFPVQALAAAGGGDRSGLVAGAARRRSVFPSREAAVEAYVGRGAFASWPRQMIADYVAGGVVDTADGTVRLACDPVFEAALYAFQAHDSWGAFERARMPIDIWRAERDSTFRLGEHEAELAARPDVSIHTVAGGTHFFPMERPEVARAALRAAAA